MFLLVSVILLTEGGLPQCMLGYHHPPPGNRHPPGADPPGSRHPPGADTPQEQTPPRAPREQTPPPRQQAPTYGQ